MKIQKEICIHAIEIIKNTRLMGSRISENNEVRVVMASFTITGTRKMHNFWEIIKEGIQA